MQPLGGPKLNEDYGDTVPSKPQNFANGIASGPIADRMEPNMEGNYVQSYCLPSCLLPLFLHASSDEHDPPMYIE